MTLAAHVLGTGRWADAGRMVTAAIERARLEQREVARQLGLSPAALSRVCSGTLRPTPENISRLARLLGINESALFVAFGLLPEPDTSGEALALRYPGERFMTTPAGAPLAFARLWGPGLLTAADVRAEREHVPYRLPDAVVRALDQLTLPPGPKYHRSKARLASLRETPHGLVFRFQRTTYLNHLLTNHQVEAGARVYLDGRWMAVADLLEPGGGALSPPERAACSNHLGLNVLLTDRTGHVLLAQRSTAATSYLPGVQFGLPAAGSMDWTDPDPFTGTLREIDEELALSDAELAPPGLLLVGVARNAARGGKPEAFFVGRALASADELNARLAAPSSAAALPATASLPPQSREVARLFPLPDTEAALTDHLESSHLDLTPETRAAFAFYLRVRDGLARRLRR
jgi:transcriptional regulator with XRE-family HTH domain